MRSLRMTFVAILIAALCACSSGGKESEILKAGEQVAKNPLGALSQLVKAGSELEKIQRDLENMKPVDPVHFDSLIAFLPAAPAGWEAGKPLGESSQLGGWKFSQARRSYSSKDKSMEVEIQDWAFQYGLYAPFFLAAALSQETSEGYQKGIKIGDDPGREEFENKARRGTLSLLVAKRFLVGVKGEGIQAAELRQWLDRMDAAGLRAKAQ